MVWIGKKSNKNFFDLEKHQACQNELRKICPDNEEVADLGKMNSAIFDFYTNFFNGKLEINSKNLFNFLKDLSAPSLLSYQKQSCYEELTKTNIYESIKSFQNKKLSCNEELKKEFYQTL